MKQLSTLCFFIAMLIVHGPAHAQLNKQITSTAVVKPNTVNAASLQKLLLKPVSMGAFTTKFSNAVTGRNDINAYLLCYLSTLIYPQYLAMVANDATAAYQQRLHTNANTFKAEFTKYTKDLFASPQYDFFSESHPSGYDPEAMVINTAATIYIVFRGTDRVGTNAPSSFGYDWAEWLKTDFDARQITDTDLPGKVLSGMWESLKFKSFKDKLYTHINNLGGKTKKVWITGHSLGAGQAQLFAMFLAKKGIIAQGVYTFAAPHPGDATFVAQANKTFPNNRLQRFDFLTDPITTLAPTALGYQRAGTRVYYNDVHSISFGTAERSATEIAHIIPGIVGAIGNTVADFINETSGRRLKLDNLLGNSTMCYHHPTWYLRAAYNQLNTQQRAGMPPPLSIPGQGDEACDVFTVDRGRTSGSNPLEIVGSAALGMVDNAVQAVSNTVSKITYNIGSLLNNVTGAAIAEGNYYILSYVSGSRLGLNHQDGIANGSELKLTTARSLVKIQRFGPAGYSISFGTNGGKEYILDSERESLDNQGSSYIQLWEKNNFPGFNMNQGWLFYKIPNHSDKYIIRNVANLKVLDAHNDCGTNSTACSVKTYKAIDSDQTQVWVLQRAN